MMKFIMLILFLFIMNYLLKVKLFYCIYLLLLLFLMMMDFSYNNLDYYMKIYYIYSFDYFSLLLTYLSIWIMFLLIMIDKNKIFLIYYNMLMNFMLFSLYMFFYSMNFLMFYIYFEFSLLPVFLLIMGWGMQIERIMAGYYMMIYTLMGSFPLLVSISYFYKVTQTMNMEFIELFNINFLFKLISILAFLIKIPMYLFHLWLPKAHVEAPLCGSMILSGVMLKLGIYGLLRMNLILLEMILYNKYLIVMSLLGGIYSGLICLLQVDMKKLVAYSSVVHMSILLMGLLTMNEWGYMGSLIMMVAHGLCSSGLFCLVNVMYERSSSRSLLINKGMINIFPSLSLIWFLLCSSNMSFPPSLNLFGEIMLLNSMLIWNESIYIMMILLMFLSAMYSLYLYSFSQHGELINLNYMMNISVNEYMNLLFHWIPLNLMFLIINMFI